jgi:hypothetical protein
MVCWEPCSRPIRTKEDGQQRVHRTEAGLDGPGELKGATGPPAPFDR